MTATHTSADSFRDACRRQRAVAQVALAVALSTAAGAALAQTPRFSERHAPVSLRAEDTSGSLSSRHAMPAGRRTALAHPSVTPIAMAAVRPERTPHARQDSDRLRSSLSWRADELSHDDRRLGVRRRQAAGRAFRAELREEALFFRNSSPWANVPDVMLDDEWVRERREDAAEDIITDATEEALATLVFGPRFRERAEVHLLSLSTSGIRLSDDPSWTFRRGSRDAGMRFDVPLTPSSIRFRAWRQPKKPGSPDRIATSIALDPWDEEARFVFAVEF